MKKVILIKWTMILIGMIIPTVSIYAEETDKTVTLVVSGEATSKDEAIKQALRSAIEQTFGTFVSANTEVLNDELIKDEIVTVSTGNITGYKEIDTYQTKDGNYFTTLEATVSIGTLTNFARSKGVTAELASGTFAMNMKIRELNKKNEVLAIKDLQKKLFLMYQSFNFFDYNLVLGEPYLKGNNYAVQAKVEIKPNINLANFRNTIISTLKSLSLSKSEKEEYERAKIPFKTIKVREYKSDQIFLSDIQGRIGQRYKDSEIISIYLRNTDSGYPNLLFPWLMINNELGFAVIDNIQSAFGFYFCNVEPYPEEKYLLAHQAISQWANTNFNEDYRNAKENWARYWFSGTIANDENLFSRVIPKKFIYYKMEENFDIEVIEAEQGRINAYEAPAYFLFEIEYPQNLFTQVNNIEVVLSKPYFLK